MVQAPEPGVSRRQEENEQAQRVMVLKIKGAEFRIAAHNLPMAERMAVRQALGMPIEAFAGGRTSIGLDSIAVLWWLARRKNERGLPWEQAASEWDNLAVGLDDVDVEIEEPGGDDPEV